MTYPNVFDASSNASTVVQGNVCLTCTEAGLMLTTFLKKSGKNLVVIPEAKDTVRSARKRA
eukprot:672562-Prorocentrum_minimum.AAC.1